MGMVCGRPGLTGTSGPGPPRHTQVTLTSIGIENGGSHLGVLGGVSGTHFQPPPLLTHMLCGHAGSERISGSRQNGDAGNSAHPTDGDTDDDGGAGSLITGWPGDGLALGAGAETLGVGVMAKADPAVSVNMAIADSAIALGMIFMWNLPRIFRHASLHVRRRIRRSHADQAWTRHGSGTDQAAITTSGCGSA
jgi:hypothetical protein